MHVAGTLQPRQGAGDTTCLWVRVLATKDLTPRDKSHTGMGSCAWHKLLLAVMSYLLLAPRAAVVLDAVQPGNHASAFTAPTGPDSFMPVCNHQDTPNQPLCSETFQFAQWLDTTQPITFTCHTSSGRGEQECAHHHHHHHLLGPHMSQHPTLHVWLVILLQIREEARKQQEELERILEENKRRVEAAQAAAAAAAALGQQGDAGPGPSSSTGTAAAAAGTVARRPSARAGGGMILVE